MDWINMDFGAPMLVHRWETKRSSKNQWQNVKWQKDIINGVACLFSRPPLIITCFPSSGSSIEL